MLEFYASEAFKAALQIWTVGASELALRERIRPLEDTFARGIYDQAVRFLNAGVSYERTHRFIQTTLDLTRALGLADLLSDDSARRKRIANSGPVRCARSDSYPNSRPTTPRQRHRRMSRNGRGNPSLGPEDSYVRACEWYSALGTRPSALETRFVMLNIPMTCTASMIS